MKIIKGRLEEVKSFIGCERFKYEVAKAKEVFQRFKVISEQNASLQQGLLNDIEENLANLTEDVEEYLDRKEKRLSSILRSIPIDLTDRDVDERGALMIKDMQLGKMPSDQLEICLHSLGIKGEEKKIWVEANRSCLGRKKMVSPEESKQDETLELVQIQRLIKKIQSRIQRLDKLMIHQNSRSVMKDSLLLFACQYLISDFRSAASNLELSLESIKYTMPRWNSEFIQEIQRDLLSFMEIGNDILHAHDISEPGTMTSDGRKLFTHQDIAKLIYDISVGKDHDVLMHSLLSKLETLKKFFRV